MLGNFDIHNPGNIRKSNDLFKGEVRPSSNASFKQFVNNMYGYRAMLKILIAYFKKGYNTIFSIIARWAPTFENKTQDYIYFVSNRMKINANAKLSFQQLPTLIYYMTWYENGFPGDRNEINRVFIKMGNSHNMTKPAVINNYSLLEILGGAATAFLIFKLIPKWK